ncbi:MAG: acpA [Marmoricola sp.]|jgi:acyl carrier protein|nr:acpA [Marmoricola sp.]MCW2836019.1 acpA [Marmoricola sp.]
MSVRPVGRSDVLAQLAEIVALVTERPADAVQLDRTFVDDLRIDSLSMVEILEGASRHFGLHIKDEAAKDFVHVRDLVDHLSARLSRP